VIREARERRRSRHRQVASVLVVIGAGLAGCMAALLSGGRVARDAQPSPTLSAHRADTGFDVRLSPALAGGEYGWCIGIQYSSAIAGGGCGAVFSTADPIAWSASEASAGSRHETIVAITTPDVASVLLDGARRVPTVGLSGLPYGMRAVRIELPLEVTRSRSGRLGFHRPPEATLVALSGDGRVLPSSPTGRREPLVSVHGHRAPCSISASGLSGLRRDWSHVAPAIHPALAPIIGRAFLSCIDVEYSVQNWPVDAALLLDATHPGSLPAAIPGLRSIAGQQGYFNGPGDFKGELTAKRQGATWLVVAGGRSLSQRLEVLRHLKSGVHL
jgi:hypothetical protein